MIPKIVFTYWEGDQLSELHYLTIYSLHKYNPELDIIIYTDETPKNILREWNTQEHSIDIKKKIPLSKLVEVNPTKIRLIPINFQKEYDFDNNISIIFKADFTRIAKLYEHGGIWFDMDILFVKPIPDFFFQEEVDSFIFIYKKVILTGFLASIPKSKYLENLYKRSFEIIKNKELTVYQKIGPVIWIEEHKKLDENENIKILDNIFVYPFLCKKLDYLFKKQNIIIPENTFGIHWYNGAIQTKKFINNFNIANINPNNSLVEKIVYNIKSDNISQDVQDVPDVQDVIIEFLNSNNLEKIQDEYYNKILNINYNIHLVFIIPKKLLKTRVFTFYKCWRNGYCLNDSTIKIPKNIKKIILKKI
jgi:mannosyltransferase OCH1-like enzyme